MGKKALNSHSGRREPLHTISNEKASYALPVLTLLTVFLGTQTPGHHVFFLPSHSIVPLNDWSTQNVIRSIGRASERSSL